MRGTQTGRYLQIRSINISKQNLTRETACPSTWKDWRKCKKSLNTRIPRNPKYQHVKTKLDTGASMSKHLEKMEETNKYYKYRKDELFKRLKVTTFAQLILNVAALSDLNEDGVREENQPEPLIPLEQPLETTNGSPKPTGETTTRSTMLSVITGVGELCVHPKPKPSLSSSGVTDVPPPDCPYLLLDVRDREQYDLCHLIGAHSLPGTWMSRTLIPYPKNVLDYKNVRGKIIIVYDEDETAANKVATYMSEKGFENLFLLSGGLKVIALKFPEGMTTGTIPKSCFSPPTRRKKQHLWQGETLQMAEERWWFTAHELSRIKEQLEKLIPSNPNSRMSSRMSTISSQSDTCSTSSRLGSSCGSSRVQSSRPWR
ncbi:centrosomal protein of 41 kDa-like [Neosynchiropus ocellatus]